MRHVSRAARGAFLLFFLYMLLAGNVHAAGTTPVQQVCPEGTYDSGPMNKTDSSSSKCTKCPLGAECPGGAVIKPLDGYWRSSSTSTQVHRCPRYGSCEAGQCAEGYAGNLCGAAAPGYNLKRPFTVARCMPTINSVCVYVSGLIVLFVAICLMVMSTMTDNARCIAQAKVSNPDKECTCPFRCGFVGVVIRHVQHMMIINVNMMTWPAGLRALFSSATWFLSVAGLSSELGSFSCWYHGASKVPWAMFKLLASLITPFVMCFAVVATVLALRLVLRRLGLHSVDRRPNMFTVLAQASVPVVGMVSCLIIVFFFWPSLVYSSLSLFACYPIDHAGDPGAMATAVNGYWISDIQQACFVGWHLKWTLALGLPVVLMVLSMPFQIAGGFFMNRAKLQTEAFKSVVGFMYHNYRDSAYFWEPINAIELAVVVTVHCFSYTLGPYYSVLLLNISFALFFLLQLALHPHAYKELHQLQLTSLGLLCFTTYICLTLLPQSSGVSEPQKPLQVYGAVIGIFAFLVNAAFVAWGLWEICRLSRMKVVQAWGTLVKCVQPGRQV